MTAADKLRELLASRPAMPNTSDLVRWWRTGGELVAAFLQERAELVSDLVVADKRNEQQRADLDAERAKLRREQDARAELRLELDRVKAERDKYMHELAVRNGMPPSGRWA